MAFRVITPAPQLIIDTESLFCDFVGTDTRWVFRGVCAVSYIQDSYFDRVDWDNQFGCTFVNTLGEQEEYALHFMFIPDDDIEAAEPNEKENKA